MNTVTRDDAEELASMVDGRVYEDYIGRGMYSSSCFGIVHDVSDVLLGVSLANVMPDDADDLARAARSDSMGHDTITYFPGWTLAEEDK